MSIPPVGPGASPINRNNQPEDSKAATPDPVAAKPVDSHEVAHAASHLMHELHLGAEVAEIVHHTQHLNKAKKVLTGFKRLSHDLQKARHVLKKAEAAGDTIKAAKIGKAINSIDDAIRAERPLFDAAVKLVAHHKPGVVATKTAEVASKFSKLAETSKLGQGFMKVGRAAAHPMVAKSLLVVGAAIDGVNGYLESPAKTQGGKIANGVLSAGGGALLMSVPIVAAADLLIAPDGYKPSEVFKGTAAGLTAIGEGVATGDVRAAMDMNKRLKAGEYGEIMKEASEAGDFWSNHGVGGTFELLWDNL